MSFYFRSISFLESGRSKNSVFFTLIIFTIVKAVANILLIYAYNHNYSNKNVVTWGSILQSIGYSPLFLATLSAYSQYLTDNDPNAAPIHPKFGGPIVRLFFLGNMAAIILVIVGYTSYKGSGAETHSNIELKIGEFIFLGITVALLLLTATRSARPGYQVVKIGLIVGLCLLLVRAIYSVYHSFHMDKSAAWATQLFLIYVPEILVVFDYLYFGWKLPAPEAPAMFGQPFAPNAYGAPPPPNNMYGVPPPFPPNAYGPPPPNSYGPPPPNTYPPPPSNTYGSPFESVDDDKYYNGHH